MTNNTAKEDGVYEWMQKYLEKRKDRKYLDTIAQAMRERWLEDGVWENRDGWRVAIYILKMGTGRCPRHCKACKAW